MILFTSGRTDVVAFYSQWFINRVKQGYFDVRNPFNPSLVSRIHKEDIDAYVFCTKNPLPLEQVLPLLDKPVYIQVTLTGYHKDIEPMVPDKRETIECIKRLSKAYGSNRLVVRYDPIFLSLDYPKEYHVKALEKIASELSPYIERIIFSFMDDYKNVRQNRNALKALPIEEKDYIYLAGSFQRIAKEYQIPIEACCEDAVIHYGFTKGACVSQKKMFELTGKVFKKWHERDCECAELVDIGAYNTCPHMCKYCYANFDEKQIKENIRFHREDSSLLLGELREEDTIKRRRG